MFTILVFCSISWLFGHQAGLLKLRKNISHQNNYKETNCNRRKSKRWRKKTSKGKWGRGGENGEDKNSCLSHPEEIFPWAFWLATRWTVCSMLVTCYHLGFSFHYHPWDFFCQSLILNHISLGPRFTLHLLFHFSRTYPPASS